jgi:hypothetical protein
LYPLAKLKCISPRGWKDLAVRRRREEPAYWHRATAEQELGNSAEAEKDFSVAENSLREAEKALGSEKIAAYCHELVNRVAAQYAAH